jgi:hypothetical protein
MKTLVIDDQEFCYPFIKRLCMIPLMAEAMHSANAAWRTISRRNRWPCLSWRR